MNPAQPPPRPGELTSLRDTAFLALTVLFGLQLLRVLLPGLVFYIRDAQGAHPAVPGAYAFILFLLVFLAVPVHRLLGHERTLILTAGGLGLVKLVEQMAPWPVVDLGMATFGTALFLWFIPTYVGHVRRRGWHGGSALVAGLLLGIAIDTAIKGVFGTLDLSWQPGLATYLLVIFLVGFQWLLLREVVREREPDPMGNGLWLKLAPLLALGPILFLESLLFQNIGQQTSLTAWDQPLVFLWIIMANAVGLVVAMGVLARPRYGGVISLVALGGLFLLLALGERSGVGAAMVALLGQVAVSMAAAAVLLAVVSSEARPGIGASTVSAGLGMLLLLVLDFLYYVDYQTGIPGGNSIVPLAAVAIIFACVCGSLPAVPRVHRRPAIWVPATAFLLLVIPLGYLAAWEEPKPVSPSGFPVRVMSYNLHQGFDVKGNLAIKDLADAIEGRSPDVVALQEVSRGWVIDGSFDMLVWLSRRLELPYVWGPAADSVWGNAILSRYPISDPRITPMPNNSEIPMKRSFTSVRIDVGGGQSLRVIATHLHNPPEEGHLREPQVQALLQAWDNEELTVIMGDFNAMPEDPEMLLLQEAGLNDAFLASPPGFTEDGRSGPRAGDAGDVPRDGYTYPSKSPARRIDYIWLSADLEVSDFSLTEGLASDHLGLAVTLDR